MGKGPSTQETEQYKEATKQLPENDLEELRSLILAPEQEKLKQLELRLDTPDQRIDDISTVLPEAIRRRSSQDSSLTDALMPMVEEAISTSTRNDPKRIVDAIFPIMGPAIRKAVSNALGELTDSINRILEQSLSLKSIKWRYEAFRTGVPYSEVVLKHTLVYRVEQVFLIHKDSGLLLQHLVADSVQALDADLVSGMLTAIQDFVQDSFKVEGGQSLDNFRVGELNVWLEQGPYAVLAAVVRGHPPAKLRTVLRDAIEAVHLDKGHIIESFQGDMSEFESTRIYLESCLASKLKDEKERSYALLWVLLSALAIILLVWFAFSYRSNLRWSNYVETLRSEPGIIVTSAEKRGGKYYLTGMVDPMAEDPSSFLEKANIEPDDVVGAWESYYSFTPEFVLPRATDLLGAPETLKFKFEDGVLSARGVAKDRWLVRAESIARLIPGVMSYDFSEVVNSDRELFEMTKNEIEDMRVRFIVGTTTIVPGQNKLLDEVVTKIGELKEQVKLLDKKVVVEVKGHTDSTGTERNNMQLSKDRANVVMEAVKLRGISPDNIRLFGVGSTEPISEETDEKNKALNRRVSFRVLEEEQEGN